MKSLVDQVAYNQWGNRRVIDAASELSPERFTQPMGSSFPSVQQTFVHIVWAEELWLERWQGRSFVRTLDPGEYPTLDAIERKIRDLHAGQLRFLEGLDPGTQDRRVSYVNVQGERWEYSLRQMVQHLVLHSAYHRGQVVTLLRQLRVVPPNTDYLTFIDDSSQSSSE